MVDSRDIALLDPILQRGYHELIRRATQQGIKNIGCSNTYRDAAYQNFLYEQGRTRTGLVVTWVRGGDSYHQYGLAFDLFQNVKDDLYNVPFLEKLGAIWKEMGGVWGGDWSPNKDRPHFEYTTGVTIKDLKAGKKLQTPMPWEREKIPSTVGRYNNIEEIPIWAKETVQKLIKLEVLNGDGNGLDLSLDMLRLLVMNDRLTRLPKHSGQVKRGAE